jgi:hypothetical protein
VGIGAGAAVAGDRRVDQAGVGGEHGVGTEAEPLDGVGTEVGEEDVGGRQQLLHGRPARPIGVGEVEDDRPLAPVVEVERGARQVGPAPAGDRQHPPHRVAFGGFDLDDVGAPIGEHATGARPGHPHAQLDDPNPLQHGADPTRRVVGRWGG